MTPAGENAVADVYATYTYGADGERSLTVQSAGDSYYFYIPEDFGGAAAPKVTVHGHDGLDGQAGDHCQRDA